MQITGSNTIIYVDPWTETVAFYRDVIGLTSSFENDWFVEFGLVGHGRLSVAHAARSTIAAGNGAGITLSWQVPDVDAACEHLARNGVTSTPIVTRWGGATTFFHDPAGNRIEFWSPL